MWVFSSDYVVVDLFRVVDGKIIEHWDVVAGLAVLDALREEGVIVQPTGDHLDILKIKPPLCIDPAGAGTLDRVLAELGKSAPDLD